MSADPYGVKRDTPSTVTQKQVGTQEFKARVQRPDPGYQGRLVTSHGVIEQSHGREILRTRYRSGSFTESHFTPGNDAQPHSAYHFSKRDNTVYQVKSARATNTRKEHRNVEHLF